MTTFVVEFGEEESESFRVWRAADAWAKEHAGPDYKIEAVEDAPDGEVAPKRTRRRKAKAAEE